MINVVFRESVFSEIKGCYRKIKLNKLANGQEWDKDETIHQAFKSVPLEHVRKHIQHARTVLRIDAEDN